MFPPKMPWPGVLLALLGVSVMLVSGVGAILTGAVLLLWLGTLYIARPAPPLPRRNDSGVQFTRARIESLMEPLGVPLVMLDRDRIQFANAAAREVLGSHILGQDVRMALRHPDAVALLESGGTATIPGLTTPRSIWQVSRRQIDDRYSMVELINRTAEADIDRAHTDFVANASHELSTPLASIIGYVETLSEGDATVDAATSSRFLATVLREARRLQHLVQDLMSLSRIEAEKHDRPRELVDLGHLAASVATDLSANRGDGRVMVEWPREPATIEGDRSQLDQLLRNLIDNALKYGDPAEPVTVAVESTPRDVTLTVEDRGPGIAPEHLPHLTRRFYRTDPGRSRAAGGTGLGLAIVKHIVERHQGRLDIASTVGKGTVVTVRFKTIVGAELADEVLS
ncbi:cell wall metabolism sensor histidine kinase WalK [Novosphingobium sp. Gsoil 351]|uniref:sensor histidine kinase n=1 Tax=Novosphingobium sp. Gsoil 351 TaxID=2675225 RepID=UPI0012B49BF2|nr:ATP-binding protein [Novosphingobium sp. Gsoil 351]QGN53388.1 two-component sensor histidine kinase [Novosphingobium sp. Gsoil 351]